MNATKPHIMIIEARFYPEISDNLAQGAIAALEEASATYECFSVAGALEIPAAIKIASEKGKFDGYIALGCVLRGETYHFEVVANESARGLTWLSIDPGLLIGNGILTCDTEEQAVERADPDRMDKGGDAARAVLALLEIKKQCA
ncbi:MAG: 6,7-dimethyl-8-ribityllumazine synthase [Alphaproteobacteria bacterium]|nr:6,7-dimethyl-8-ribityllumazine synthase [Alphaproteobacteria bacterium]